MHNHHAGLTIKEGFVLSLLLIGTFMLILFLGLVVVECVHFYDMWIER